MTCKHGKREPIPGHLRDQRGGGGQQGDFCTYHISLLGRLTEENLLKCSYIHVQPLTTEKGTV